MQLRNIHLSTTVVVCLLIFNGCKSKLESKSNSSNKSSNDVVSLEVQSSANELNLNGNSVEIFAYAYDKKKVKTDVSALAEIKSFDESSAKIKRFDEKVFLLPMSNPKSGEVEVVASFNNLKAKKIFKIKSAEEKDDKSSSDKSASKTSTNVVEIPDTTSPVPGSLGKITFSNISTTGFTLNWTAGSDEATSAGNLKYRVFMSSTDNLSSASTVTTNGTPLSDWTYNISSFPVAGLTVNTKYYFNVLVKDEAGNTSAYEKTSGAPSPSLQWFGSLLSLNKWVSGGSYGSNIRVEEAIYRPYSIVKYGAYLYVSLGNNSDSAKIVRYVAATGDYAGWIGIVRETPTGGVSGCTTAAVNSQTPGWCTGGSSGTPNAAYTSIATDGTYLYALDMFGSRIIRYDLTSGAFVDNLASIPFQNYNTVHMSLGPDGYIYVAERVYHRVSRYNKTTGADGGWIGKIATVPTSPASCAAAAVGSFTPTWCFGGSAASGTSEGAFDGPSGVVADNTYLYISEFSNARVTKRLSSDGSFVGAVGLISNVGARPTGGASGCTSMAALEVTPGWCTGGSYWDGYGLNDALSYPGDISYDGTNLYVYSGYDRNVKKFVATTGQYLGWIGAGATGATSGAAGCSAISNSLAPGWCFGGSGAAGVEGTKNGTSAVFADASGYIYSAVGNHIDRNDAVTGAYDSWLGLSAQAPALLTSGTIGVSSSQGVDAEFGIATGPDGILLTSGGNKFNAVRGHDILTGATISGINFSAGENHKYITDGTYVYSSEENGTVIRKRTMNGTLIGWSGAIGVSPTGGAPGCAGAAVGTITPGWCTGGNYAASGLAGGYGNYTARPLNVDPITDSLYTYNAGAIYKLKASTGEFIGAIGNLASVPTGPDALCLSGIVGSKSPKWCLGSYFNIGNTEDSFYYGEWSNMTYSTSGKLFSKSVNTGIRRYNAITGTYEGQQGWVTSTPTGGDAGCTTAGWAMAPGWCTGGTYNAWGYSDNMLTMVADQNNIYSAHSTGDIRRFNVSNGQFTGWRGQIAVSPTGGDPGCAGASVGSITPGWCTGGSATTGSQLGAFVNPVRIAIDSMGNLIVFDQNNAVFTKIVIK